MLSIDTYRIRSTPWLGRLVLKSIPDVRWKIEIEPVGKFAIRLRQHRMFWLRPPLVHEGFMLGSLQRLLHEGDVVYDIGANIGLYCRFMIQVFKASHVYAFEPMQNNCAMIAENLKLAGCSDRVTIVSSAIGDEDGTTEFQVDSLTSNSGALNTVTQGKASASHSQYGLPATVATVRAARLDTLCETPGFRKPDLIKLDVEGAEAMALEGARRMLQQHQPRLAIELHGAAVARQVLEFLWSLHYHCFGYLEAGGVSTYKEIVPEDLKSIAELYSLHFVVASTRAADLVEPIQDFVVAHVG
jgi:FkbM family methyltransferase